jgi:O-methyltransferase involved in polyketide biosynthesis
MSDVQLPPHRSHTAVPSTDQLSIGKSAGQRSAEIVAGVRAELTPSPVTTALSRLGGRVAARIFMALAGRSQRAGFNFLIARTQGMTELTREFLKTRESKGIMVEVGAGFSPRGIELAQSMPNLEVIEIDLPDVIQEKQKRLKKIQNFTLPSNLTFIEADLGIIPLATVLKNREVDVIAAEGLLPYFTHEQQILITHRFLNSLKPDGALVCDYVPDKSMQEGGETAKWFQRQAGRWIGKVEDAAEATTLLTKAGFERISMSLPSELAKRFPSLPSSVGDYELIAIAYKPKAETKTS